MTMRIPVLLSYNLPRISGLTLLAAHTAEGFAAAGDQVTVLTARHGARLPAEEVREGVRVIRVKVRMRVSKGVVLRGYGRWVMELLRIHNLLWVYLPASPQQSLWAAALARWLRKPLAMEYACDVRPPGGIAGRVIEYGLVAAN